MLEECGTGGRGGGGVIGRKVEERPLAKTHDSGITGGKRHTVSPITRTRVGEPRVYAYTTLESVALWNCFHICL